MVGEHWFSKHVNIRPMGNANIDTSNTYRSHDQVMMSHDQSHDIKSNQSNQTQNITQKKAVMSHDILMTSMTH